MKKNFIYIGGLVLALSSCSFMVGTAGSAASSVMSAYVSALETTLEMNPVANELLETSMEYCPENLRTGSLLCTTTRGDSASYWSKGHCVGFEYDGEENDDVVATYAYHPKGCAQITIEGENEAGDPFKLTYELFFESVGRGTVFETYTCDSEIETGKGTFILR
jgi:hypothetical protein